MNSENRTPDGQTPFEHRPAPAPAANRPVALTPAATYSLIAINVVVFLVETLAGGSEDIETALRFGALYLPLLTGNGEWWRLFTSMFLHFGIRHLGSNMLALFALGPNVEIYFGRRRYLLIYFFSGICGGLLTIASSLYLNPASAETSVSAGASGAIFGLLGTYIVIAMTPRLRRAFPLRRVLLSVLISLYPALVDSSISMTAHVGGLIGGFLLSLILNRGNMEMPKKTTERRDLWG